MFGGVGVIWCLSSLLSTGAGGGEQHRLFLGDFSSVSPPVLSCACPDDTARLQPPWPILQLIGAGEISFPSRLSPVAGSHGSNHGSVLQGAGGECRGQRSATRPLNPPQINRAQQWHGSKARLLQGRDRQPPHRGPRGFIPRG